MLSKGLVMRSTFSRLNKLFYHREAASALLDISDEVLRECLSDNDAYIEKNFANLPKSETVKLFSLLDIFKIAAWRRKWTQVDSLAQKPVFIAVALVNDTASKSATAAELCIQLQLSGYRTLIIDLDIGARLTQIMGYEPDIEVCEAVENDLELKAIVTGTFFEVCKPHLENFTFAETEAENVAKYIKWPFGPDGPALIPSDSSLGTLEHTLAKVVNEPNLRFHSFFKASAAGKTPGLDIKNFDIVFLNSPSTSGNIALNVIAAADYVVAPVKIDAYGVKRVSRLVSEITSSEISASKHAKLIILPTSYTDEISRTARMSQRLHIYKENMSNITIGPSDLLQVSLEYYCPLTLQQPASTPAKEYRRFKNFLLQKIATRE